MKIVQINTYNNRGGAAAAALRLHLGLRRLQADSRMLVRYKQSTDESVSGITVEGDQVSYERKINLFSEIQEEHINKNRSDISNTFFTLPYPGCDLSHHPLVLDADLINLHWIAQYQSPVTINKLFALGKPVVWTLHDQWAFTGGCHYAAGCNKYCADCSQCPQLAADPFDLPSAILKDKVELFKSANLTIVSPSRWLADSARHSVLFRDFRIETIPNSLDTGVFSPRSKQAAKADLGISDQTITILFGADNGAEKRKGFHQLMEAIRHCLAIAEFRDLAKNNRIRILCAGLPNSELEAIGIPVLSLGYLASDEEMRIAYSAADIFVLPSLEDNLPNTLLEAQSCGTPVIAFNTGGMPDVINEETGILITPYDTYALGNAIYSLAINPDKREAMSQKARLRMIEQYSLERQAERYLGLYESLHKYETGRHNLTCKSDNVNNSADASVTIDTGIGNNFRMIFDKVLFNSLKDASFCPVGESSSTSRRHISAKTLDNFSYNRKNVFQAMPPRISIVTPSFNQGQFLEECIDSILSQNYPNLEYIIMDGGSTDNSVEIIKKYEKHLAYWQSKPDGGQYAAINDAFKNTSGEIMAWLNSDDKYLASSLFKAACLFTKHKAIEWITGRPTVFDKDGNFLCIFDYLPVFGREKYLSEGYGKPFIQQESTFWRRSLWEKAGAMMRTDLGFAGDMELWIRFFRHAQLFTVDAMLGGYRFHGNQKAVLHLDKYTAEADKKLSEEIALINSGEFPEMRPAVEPIAIRPDDLKIFMNDIYEMIPPNKACGPSNDLELAVSYFISKIAETHADDMRTIQSLEARLQNGGSSGDHQRSIQDTGTAELHTLIDDLTQQLAAANSQLNKILSGNSWFLTRPLRVIRGMLTSKSYRNSIRNIIAAKLDSASFVKRVQIISASDPVPKASIKAAVPPLQSRLSKTARLFSDAQLRELASRYKCYPTLPLSYATVKDFCDSFDHMRPFAELNGDLKDIQRTWTLKTLLALLPDSARVLEIGAGEPWVSDLLARLGHEVWICDPYDGTGNGPVEYDKYRDECPDIRFVRASFGANALDISPHYFDAVFSISVLEHVPIAGQNEMFAGIRKYLKPSGHSIHSVDHVLKGNGAVPLLHKLRRINILSGNTDADLDAALCALSDDVETYYLSAESHNRWRRRLPYEQFPMRVCISIHFCSPHGKILG